jgi:hypothetical protein
MIVVVGSSHDSVATDLVASWPQAALCSAEDLVSPGWVWRHGQPASRTWIVDKKEVSDDRVTGVFVRRASVYAEELMTTHPDDRAYLASEIHAFLVFVLASTSARVVNPINEGAFGEAALRPHRWIHLASQLGISIRPLRVSSEPRRPVRYRTFTVEVVGDEVFGDAPANLHESARRLAEALEIGWGVFVFDTRKRLVTVTTARRPSEVAAAALSRSLEAKRT